MYADIAKLDKMIILVTDSLKACYNSNNDLKSLFTLKKVLSDWKSTNEELLSLYEVNFIIGTDRGIITAAYERDLKKQMLINLLPILRLSPFNPSLARAYSSCP